MAEVGDVVRVGRGTWGLKEWYPGRSFKTKDAKDEVSEAKPAASPAAPSKGGIRKRTAEGIFE
jgi:hypothetical protein